MGEGEYSILMRYFTYLNLVRSSVDRLVGGVYSKVTRQIEEGSPYKDEVDEFLSPANGYSLTCKEWFKSAVLFGTGILAFRIRNNEVVPWLPNPINTEIISSPYDVEDVELIIEKVGSNEEVQYRWVDKNGWGVSDNSGNIVAYHPHGLGIVPAVMAYGESQLQFGKVKGRSLVHAGVQYSCVITRLLLNMTELIKTYSDPKGVASGAVMNQDKNEVFEKGAVIEMESGGSFTWATPDTNFKDLKDTISQYKVDYCISAGIPIDALDPSAMPENLSATGAALRFGGLSVTIGRLTDEQKIAEIKALTIVGALYQFIKTLKPVTFWDFKKRFRANVTMQKSNVAVSFQEEVTAWQQLESMGAKTREDLIRHFGEDYSEKEIQRRLALPVQSQALYDIEQKESAQITQLPEDPEAQEAA